jgi:hypothetical protein
MVESRQWHIGAVMANTLARMTEIATSGVACTRSGLPTYGEVVLGYSCVIGHIVSTELAG